MADKAFQRDGVWVKLVDLSEDLYVTGADTVEAHAIAVASIDSDYQARQGQAWRAWQQDLVPGAAKTVLTTPAQGETGGSGIGLDLVAGRVYYITQIHYGIHLVSDSCTFEIGYTPYTGGSGTFVPLACERSMFTGAAIAGFTEEPGHTFVPPLRVPSAAACITFQVDANDAGCIICLEHAGYWV